MIEHEIEYTDMPETPTRFWACWSRLESGELVAWVAASSGNVPNLDDCEAMGPYDSAAEASGVCQRIKGDREPEA